MKKKNFIFIIFIIFIFTTGFTAIIKATDGNTLKVNVLEIKDGKAVIKGFFDEITVTLDNLSYISFDENTSDKEGIVISDYNLSGYIKEYNSETNQATVVTTSGDFMITDLNVIKYWNIRQNTIKDELKRTFNNKKFEFYIGENTFYSGDLMKISDKNVYINVENLGEEKFSIDYLTTLHRDKKNELPPNSILTSKGLLLKYNDLNYENDKLVAKLDFGDFSTNIKSVESISGNSKQVDNLDYYFVLKNNIRFYAKILEFSDQNIKIKTFFNEHTLKLSDISYFSKVPKNNDYILVTNNKIMYGEYSEDKDSYILKNENQSQVKNVKIISKDRNEILKDSFENLYNISLSSEKNNSLLKDKNLYIFIKNAVKIFDSDNMNLKTQIESPVFNPAGIIMDGENYIIYNSLGEIYFSKDNSKYDISENIAGDINLADKKYIYTREGKVYNLKEKSDTTLKTVYDFKEKIYKFNGTYYLNTKNQIKDIQGNTIVSFENNVKDFSEDKNVFYAIDDNNLYKYNMNTNQKETIKTDKKIYFIKQSTDYIMISAEKELYFISKNTLETENSITTEESILTFSFEEDKIYISTKDGINVVKIFEK
ncbi:MAG TPA: hypothetical protein PLS66_10685 [Tepiditoga sp.]|nr:hypothetical protein [Tepiditoga sp.]